MKLLHKVVDQRSGGRTFPFASFFRFYDSVYLLSVVLKPVIDIFSFVAALSLAFREFEINRLLLCFQFLIEIRIDLLLLLYPCIQFRKRNLQQLPAKPLNGCEPLFLNLS